jgi:hypothetical protein
MPRKKDTSHILQPGFDIFEQALPEADRGVMLKTHYRRKQLAGFVPLWNEFFRCYHLAGVSPNAVYLWAYLRQYEHERREWNAVSDISWPGRRDMAEALGVSITHLPNLLNELRRAGLVTFQLVLPGFEELAESIGATIEEVRERAADYGVNPKVDGTLYRTADPFTKSEFALQTRLKFCKGCKVFRYCEGARDAQALLSENQKNLKAPGRAGHSFAPSVKPAAALPVPTAGRKVITKKAAVTAEIELVTADRIHINTAGESKKIQSPTQYRVTDRLRPESDTVSKEIHPPTPSRVKTSINKPTTRIQPEESTTMEIDKPAKRKATQPKPAALVVDIADMNLESSKLQQVMTSATRLAETDLLRQFGFDPQTAANLAEKAFSLGKTSHYIQGILQYARENARQNPLGLARYLIERGEERLTKSDRWQQQSMFGQTIAEPEDFQAELSPAGENAAGEAEANETDHYALIRAKLAADNGLSGQTLERWNELLQLLSFTGAQNAADLFRSSLGYEDTAGNLRVIMRNLFDQRRAAAYREQLERVVIQATGKMPQIEFEY